MFPCHNYIANDNTLHQLLLQGRRQNLRARPSCQPLQRFRRQIQRSVHGKQNAQSHRNGLPGSHLTSTSTEKIAIDFPRNANDVKYVATPAKKIIRAMMKATLWIQTAEQDVKTERNCGNKVFSTPYGSVRYASQIQLRSSSSEEIKDLSIRRLPLPECAHFDTQSATDHRTSAATGHEKSTATGHRISAATGHRTSTATGQWQRAKNVSGHGSCRVSP